MEFFMIKHIFFDFNGTLINDVDLCLELLNNLLSEQKKPSVDINKYKEIFTFPIKDYYIAAGIDLQMNSFEDLSIKFINEYQPRSLECGLFSDVIQTIKKLKAESIHTYILSASEKNNLVEQCKFYNLLPLFDEILGIDNIHAGGKVSLALDFMKKTNINPNEALLIGDTIHDYEVARAIGAECRLVSTGHQSVNVLKKANAKIYSTLHEAVEEVLK